MSMGAAFKKLAWPLAIVALVAAVILYPRLRALPVETAQVLRGRVEEYVTEEARTQLHAERTVAADMAGVAERIALEEGDRVAAGQVITTIEDTRLRLSLDLMGSYVKETEARLAGADVTLPKPSQIEAADQDARRADEELRALQEEKRGSDADLALARKEAARLQALHKSGAATDRQLDEAERSLAVAQAGNAALARRLAAAEAAARVAVLRKQVLLDSMRDTAYLHRVYGAQMEQARTGMEMVSHELTKTHVTCPVDGVVLEKLVDSKGYVQPGAPLVKVGEMGSIEIRADILSDEVGRVQVGQEVLLVGPAVGDGGARGRVKKVYPSGFTKISSLGVRQQRVAVLVAFDNSGLKLQPGYELDVKIVVAAKDDAVLAPGAAVFAGARGPAVFTVSGGRARVQPIATGLKGEDTYEVVEGLQPGDTVVLRPPKDLEDGRRVKGGG
jgi:HlyD family secretion protein